MRGLQPGQLESTVEPLLIELAQAPEATSDDAMVAVLTSIGINLKRIADNFDHIAPGDNYASLYGPLTNLAWELGRSFQGGMRTDR